ncbi:hypothetical protein RCL1_007868 [Eukaryota sp. TZLM3-RCL]
MLIEVLIFFFVPCILSASVSVSRPLDLGSFSSDFNVSSFSHIISLPFNHLILFSTDSSKLSYDGFLITEILSTTSNKFTTILYEPQCFYQEKRFNLVLSDFPSQRISFTHLHVNFLSPSVSSNVVLAAYDFHPDPETNVVTSLTMKFFFFSNFSPTSYFENIIENDLITIEVPPFVLGNDQLPIANLSLDLNSFICQPSFPHLITFSSSVSLQFCMSSSGVFNTSFYQFTSVSLLLQFHSFDTLYAFFQHDSASLILLLSDNKIIVKDINQLASLSFSSPITNAVSISHVPDHSPLPQFVLLRCSTQKCEIRLISIDFNNGQLEPAGRLLTVSSSNDHSAFLFADGSLKTVGSNANGKLGDSTETPRSLPASVPLVKDAISVSCGYGHTLALRKSGVLVVFGGNSAGQLGDGTTLSRWTPRDLQISASIIEISAGNQHSLARLRNGSVLSWGRSTSGRLGNTDKVAAHDSVLTPTPVTHLFNAVAISAGDTHSLFVRADGTVVGCGANGAGRLGNGDTNSRTWITPCLFINDAVSAAAGGAHSIVLNRDGSLYVFGASAVGQLGLGTTLGHQTPQLLTGYKFVAISAGSAFSIGLLENGHVMTWGTNLDGQLGIGSMTNQLSPVRVGSLYNVFLIAAGSNQAFAVERNGTVYGWGNNLSSVLGDGTVTNRLVPTHLTALDEH